MGNAVAADDQAAFIVRQLMLAPAYCLAVAIVAHVVMLCWTLVHRFVHREAIREHKLRIQRKRQSAAIADDAPPGAGSALAV